MKLIATEAAVALFKKEWDFVEGDQIRLYPRYSGGGADPFSVGVAKMKPRYPQLTCTADGSFFFIERDDVWLLDGKETLRIDARDGEMVYDKE